MKASVLLTALILAAGWLPAQTLVSGTVKDSKGHPIRSVSITVKDTYDGATTDSLGHFNFQSTEKGDHTLTVTNIGYNPLEQPITLNGSSIDLRLVLKEQLSELKAVTITAGSFTAGDAKRGAVLSSPALMQILRPP
jgi:vitamin B12 transporter